MVAMIPTKTDKCQGAMLATAIGDALGWPNEPRAKNKAKKHSGVNDYFVEWTRYNTKPCYHYERILPGEYSDDTQMTLSVARSLIAGNWETFFVKKELPFWLKYERGGGGSLLKAAKSCKEEVLLWQSNHTQGYFNAGGNGATMRILPHIIASAQMFDIPKLMMDILKDALITHGHPRAILGAMCYAFALDYLMRKETVLEYGELVTTVIEGQQYWGAYPENNELGTWLEAANRHPDFVYASEWEHVRATMMNQLKFIQGALKKALILDDTTVLTELGCFSKADGAGDVAILAAIYIASKYANNPILGIKVPAFSLGLDTDTIASITGGLLGMLCGIDWIPNEWKIVQDYECLIRITNLLLADDSKQAAKVDLLGIKTQDAGWVNTQIGRMRKLSTETVQNGKYANVIITKWQSALGQTIYTKDMQKMDRPLRHLEKMQNPQQRTLYDNEPLQTSLSQKLQRRFILDQDSVVGLLGNPQFNGKLTSGKMMKIIQSLLAHKTSEGIAKQFNVELTLVKLIEKCVIE